MATDDPDIASQTSQNAFISVIRSVFDASADKALDIYVKLRAYMQRDSQVEAMYQQAGADGSTDDFDTLTERVRSQVMRWDLSAIARQVVMPLGSGYLAYAAAVAFGLVGGVPVLIGLLVGAMIYLRAKPGTLQMLMERMAHALDDLFGVEA